MRHFLVKYFSLMIGMSMLFSSCSHSSGSAWEDTKTLGRYIQRGSKLLFKKNPDSKLLHARDELTGPIEEDFIPLNQQELLAIDASNLSSEEPSLEKVSLETPLAEETKAPTIDSFKKPSNSLASIFKTVHFNTDDYVLRDNTSLSVIDSISNYMKKNKEIYVFILGHCDERGSEAYNLSLGTKRASYVRNLLVKKGADAAHIFTISFGKEIPVDASHNKEAWAKNRRAEFKIYEKSSTIIK